MSPRSCDLGKHESENHDLYWVCPECVTLFTKNHEIMKEELG